MSPAKSSSRSFSLAYNAPFVLTFVLCCCVAFILNGLSGGWTNAYLFSTQPELPWFHPLKFLTMISYTLGHRSLDHLAFNLSVILLIGPILEEKHGSRMLALLALATAMITGLIATALLPGHLLGASGIVFMLIILASFVNARSGQVPLTFVLVAVLFLGREVVAAFGADNVSQLIHILGGVCGGVFGFYLSGGNRS